MTSESNCPVCNHAKSELIELQITTGTELETIATHFRVSVDDIIAHIQHGDEGIIAEDSQKPPELLSTSSDEYSILRFTLLHLRTRFTNLIAVDPVSAESKELIALSRAINDTAKTIVVVKEKLGISDDTRMRELEKQIDELMMIIPELTTDDQAKVEAVLGISDVEPLATG